MKQLILALPLALVTTLAIAAPAAATPDPLRTAAERVAVSDVTADLADRSANVPRATRCPKGWFCVWPKVNYQPASKWLGGKRRGTCYSPFASGRSVSNQIGKTIRVFSRIGCRGSYFDLKTGHGSSRTPFTVRSVRT